MYIIKVYDEANNNSDGNEDKEDDTESDKEQEDDGSEARQLRSSGKRKRGGNNLSNLYLLITLNISSKLKLWIDVLQAGSRV